MKLPLQPFPNPFRPGAGHMPPYLAGREEEELEFKKLLEQRIVLQNMILTGLRQASPSQRQGQGKLDLCLKRTAQPRSIMKRYCVSTRAHQAW